MPGNLKTLKKTSCNAYYFLIALLPGTVLTTYYAGLTRKDVMIFYTDYSATIKMSVAIATALLVELIILIIKRSSIIDALKNPQTLLIGVLVGLCLPNNLTWWMISSSVFFAIIVGRYLLSNHLQAVLIGYIFSLGAFPAAHGLSTLIKSELYFNHAIQVNGAFMLGGLLLVALQKINWRIPITLFIIYSALALSYEILIKSMPLSQIVINSVLTPTTCFGLFFIAPFVVSDDASSRMRFLNGVVIGVAYFVLNQYAHYPDALLITLLVMNIVNWALAAKNIPLNYAQISSLFSHTLLTPLLSASVIMVAASSITQAAIVGAIVVVIYLSAQSIADVIKRFVPQSGVFSLIIVLTAFLSTYIGLSIKVYLPAFAQTMDNFIPLMALGSLILSCSGIFVGQQLPFKIMNALKMSALFLILVLLIGAVNQFTNMNRQFCAGLFFLFVLIALYNNPKLSSIETPNKKPNRRVRTTGTIK